MERGVIRATTLLGAAEVLARAFLAADFGRAFGGWRVSAGAGVASKSAVSAVWLAWAEIGRAFKGANALWTRSCGSKFRRGCDVPLDTQDTGVGNSDKAAIKGHG